MVYEELDELTRQYMLTEFEAEEVSAHPYRAKGLAPQGLLAFPELMRAAILTGNEQSLSAALKSGSYWYSRENYTYKGEVKSRAVNLDHTANRLGLTEFSTWYVRGFARRLLEENVEYCQVYRAAAPKGATAQCSDHEDQIFLVKEVYEGHRARYWPEPGRADALTIPFGFNCHHVIRRVHS